MGLMAAIFGGVYALFAHTLVRAADALRVGRTLLGRYRVDPSTWHRFVALDERRGRERGASFSNALACRAEYATQGVEIAIGEDAVAVGDDVYATPRGTYPVRGIARVPGSPPMLEFELLWPGAGDQSDTRNALRLPYPETPEGDAIADRVVEHYRAALESSRVGPLIPIRNRARVIGILLGLAGVCGAMALAGLFLRSSMPSHILPAVLILLGILLGGGFLIVALAVRLRPKDW